MAFTGKLPPAGVIAQLEMVLPSLPLPVVAVPVEKNIVPEVANVLEPEMVQLVMVLLLASLIKRMVEVFAVAETVVLVKVNELPPVFRPLIITLSAPFKLINALPPVVAPVMVLGPTGVMAKEVHVPAFKEAEIVDSLVSPSTEILIVASVCTPPLMAVKAPAKVAYLPFTVIAPLTNIGKNEVLEKVQFGVVFKVKLVSPEAIGVPVAVKTIF
jgi:hypothetical protein